LGSDKKDGILFEDEAKELEIMEFTVGGGFFGINVAKVIELMQYSEVTPLPNSNPYIEGVFKPRDIILTAVDLAGYMKLPPSGAERRDVFLITNFNNVNFAFHVHSVEAIHKISWSDIDALDCSLYGGDEGLVIGVTRFKDRLIAIVDFEKIIMDISPRSGIRPEDVSALSGRERSDKPILVAEDSPFLSEAILKALNSAGFSNVTRCSNGEEAWNLLLGYKEMGGDISGYAAIVVTDIEMPRMDGHKLIKLIRSDEKLNKLPVIIFSSLVGENMRVKGEEIGATAQVFKPEIAKLVNVIDEHIL
jgi:two-component system chemotaxis response regulator CheV